MSKSWTMAECTKCGGGGHVHEGQPGVILEAKGTGMGEWECVPHECPVPLSECPYCGLKHRCNNG